jgi:Iron-sulfur cluster-binding domain
LMCSYCPQPTLIKKYAELEHEGRVMPFDTFKRCLATVPTTTSVTFAGMAEPWLNPACTGMLLHAVDKGHEVVVYTTVLGMNIEDVEAMKRVRFKHLCIHLPDAEGRMKMPITDDYLTALAAIVRAFPDHNYSLIGPLHPAVRDVLGHDVPDSTSALHSRANNLKHIWQVPRRTGRLDTRHCINHNMLLPNGDVALCCQDYGLKHILGNLLRQDYASIFQGEEFSKLMRGMEDESVDILCRTCNIAVAA